jgi:2-polyprenyl-6-methoxyphenol hydroxylase-like FAD-dependent oxidoreductase
LNAAQSHPLYDVIVAGAGPVGLFLSCELALAHCSVLLLEKAQALQSPLKRLPFGMRGLSSPTIEALSRRGLLDELEMPKRLKNPHSHAVSGPRRQAGHFAGIPFYDGDIDAAQWTCRLPGATDTSLIAELEELDTVLERRALALGVTIKRGRAVSDVQQSDDSVIVWSDAERFHGRWLVGCDGSRSVVRKLGGVEFAGTEPEFTGYSTLVEIANPELLKAGRNVTSRGMYMQSQPGYVVIQDFDGGAFHQSDLPITREHLQQVLRRVSDTDVTLTALHIATSWTDRARQAASYRNGRVLLAGDAAHIHSPLGGQGLNLGLGDAMNLGWKLAATIHGTAPRDLLDTYHTERHPIGAQVLDWSRAQVAIMKPDPAARALHAIMCDLMRTRDGATYMAGRVWGIATRYDLGGAHPLVGYSVPDFEFEDARLMSDLMRDGRAVLLDFKANSTLQKFANGYGKRLRYISKRAKHQLGLAAVLLRPDGYVAWACDDVVDEPALRLAAARWLNYSPATQS